MRPLSAPLALALALAGCPSVTPPPAAPPALPGARNLLVDDLLAALAQPTVSWEAAAELQRRPPDDVVPALVAHLRADPFVDLEHGRHSITMKVLEKIGRPAIPFLDSALDDRSLAGNDHPDLVFVVTTVIVLASIDRAEALPTLLRVARTSPERGVRIQALFPLASGTPPADEWDVYDPADRNAGLRAAVAAHVDALEALVADEETYVGVQAAATLVRFGAGDARLRAVQHLAAVPGSAPEWSETALWALRDYDGPPVPDSPLASPTLDPRLGPPALRALRDPRWKDVLLRALADPSEETRRQALELAGRSHETSLVPALIERLSDEGLNGASSSREVDGAVVTVDHVLGETAAEALRQLTFQDLGRDAAAWQAWWETHAGRDWRTLRSAFVESCLARVPAADGGTRFGWLALLVDDPEASVVPLVDAVWRTPLPTETFFLETIGGASSDVRILHALGRQGDARARALLEEMAASTDHRRVEAAVALAAWDRPRALELLAENLTGCEPGVSDGLLRLGDPRGVSSFFPCLDGSDAQAAHAGLRAVTQQAIGPSPDEVRPLASWQAAKPLWETWWAGASEGYVVDLQPSRIDR